MTPRLWLSAAAALALAAPPAPAAPERRLDDELKRLAADLKDSLTTDPKLKGRKVALGLFNGPKLRGTNFGTRVERALAAELAGLLADKADLTILGRYDYAESAADVAADDRTFKLRVLRVTAEVEDDKGKVLDTKVVEVNDTDDIFAALGLVGEPPFHGNQKARNQAAEKAFREPSFTPSGTRVTAGKGSPYAVEVLVKDKADGPATAAAPKDLKGQAFVDIKPTQFYELRLYNDDEEYEAVASVTVDGLDAANTFNADGVKYPGYLIPAKGSFVVRGWLHTVKPRAKEKDNVFSFLVTEYGHGAATQLKSTGEVGVVTVQFAAAWKQGQKPPPAGTRGAGRETAKGPGVEEKLTVEQRLIGDRRATVSVRYSAPN